jgi:hypothetical protein
MFKFVFLDVQRFRFYGTPSHLEPESKKIQVNTLGTHWEQGKNEKKNSFPTTPTQNLKGRKALRHLECMLGPSNWLHEISLPKRVHHHFWPGLIPLAKNTLPIHLIHNC